MVGANRKANYLINFSTFILISAILIFAVWSYNNGLFSSTDAFREFISGFGIWAPVIFILIQVIQVVLPIAPGAVSCVAGILMFGNLSGFLYNYIGICIGSVLVFLLSKKYGNEFVKSIIGIRNYDKYAVLIEENKNFDKIFTIAIFLPLAPDDLLCYMAGLTKMKLKKFVIVILLGKPMAIALYSIGLTSVFQYLAGLIF